MNGSDPLGLITMAGAMAIGAAVGAAYGAYEQYQQHGSNFGCWDWGRVAAYAAWGALFFLIGHWAVEGGYIGTALGSIMMIPTRAIALIRMLVPTVIFLVGKSVTSPWVTGTYEQMKAITRGQGGNIQAHHILEVRHLISWGLNTMQAPAVILTRMQHTVITRALQQALPTGQVYSPEEVWNEYQKVYTEAGVPEWLNLINGYFK